MSNEVNYVADWKEEASQCQHCAAFQSQGGKNACVPPGKNFEEALNEFGEASPSGHCDYFMQK